jgi:hypothetical protein
MSEEKLYAVKNDEGEYWDTGMPPWWNDKTGSVFKRIDLALRWAKKYDGHVVTLIEEPEKVVLTKEQAEIVENAHDEEFPATYISGHAGGEEELLMNAYVNGYTVEKEKKYSVWVPHVKGKMYYKDGRGSDDLDITSAYFMNHKNQQFTEAEIEHYGLGDCQKEEVTDDEQ